MTYVKNTNSIAAAKSACRAGGDNEEGFTQPIYTRKREPQLDLAIRNYGCKLSVATLSAVTKLPGKELQAATRSAAKIALARQTAMYLAHTKFGISYSDVAAFFQRDRSTVAHACHLIEDRRDDADFDDHLNRMENLIDLAVPDTLAVQQSLAPASCGGSLHGGTV